MTIRVPDVTFDFGPLVPDAETISGRRYVARLRRIAPNPRILWETEMDFASPIDARRSMEAQIQQQADELGFNIDSIVLSIENELYWPHEAALSLALEFVFPTFLAWNDLHCHAHPYVGRGRPSIIDAQTHCVGHLAAAWQRATGFAPGFGSGSAFPAVIDAIAPHFKFRRRDGSGANLAEMRLALLREHKKLLSGRIWCSKTPSALSIELAIP